MKRIVTIQDISAVGKCSLTVALPIISAMGVETAVIPTALLSMHTAFPGFTFHDLTSEIPAILDHWQSRALTFDAIYSGYLGSEAQIELVKDAIARFGGKDCIKVVDPVMADHGRLYPGFTPAFVERMRTLCARADVIVPNLTEACLLLDIPYPKDGVCDQGKGRQIVKALCEMGCRCAVLTGMHGGEGKLGVLAYDAARERYYAYDNTCMPATFHGTGDVFSSVLTGGLTLGLGLYCAIDLAVDFTLEAIRATLADPDRRDYGVSFEHAIPYLTVEVMAKKQTMRPKGVEST